MLGQHPPCPQTRRVYVFPETFGWSVEKQSTGLGLFFESEMLWSFLSSGLCRSSHDLVGQMTPSSRKNGWNGLTLHYKILPALSASHILLSLRPLGHGEREKHLAGLLQNLEFILLQGPTHNYSHFLAVRWVFHQDLLGSLSLSLTLISHYKGSLKRQQLYQQQPSPVHFEQMCFNWEDIFEPLSSQEAGITACHKLFALFQNCVPSRGKNKGHGALRSFPALVPLK